MRTPLAILLLLVPTLCSAETLHLTVLDAHDVDTIHAGDGETIYTLRCHLADGPEVIPAQAYGEEAAAMIRRVMVGKAIDAKVVSRSYKRLVADVTWSEGRYSWAATIVAKGAGMVDLRYAKTVAEKAEAKRLLVMQENAKAKHLGLWESKSPEPPWIFRERKKAESRERRMLYQDMPRDNMGVPVVRQVSSLGDTWKYRESAGQFIVGPVCYVYDDGAYIWKIQGRCGANASGAWPYSSIWVRTKGRILTKGQLAFLAWDVAAQEYSIECVLPDPLSLEAQYP